MKHILILVFSILLLVPLFGQSNLEQNAELYANSIIERNFDRVAELMHPDIIEIGGGAEFIISDLQNDRQSIVDQGMEYIGFELGESSQYFESEGEIQTLLPVKFKMMINNKEIESDKNLLAFSNDKGESWVFVDLSKFDKESLNKFVKNISPDINLPGY